MARGKKKERALTPEEQLAQALVPDWEQPYKVPENWCWVYLFKGAAKCMDSFRKPVNATERAGREGEIPYYGATGQVGWIDDYLTDEELVLLGEDGAPFLDPLKDKAYLISGKAWVNNHAHILRSYYGSAGNQYLVNYLNTFNYKGYVNGTTRLKLTQASMEVMPVPIPPLSEQQRIVDRIEYLFTKLDEAKEKARSVLDSFEPRKAAILHKAFTGELTAKWRTEHSDQIGDIDVTPLDKSYDDYDVPHDLPLAWRWVLFNDCCTFVGSGVTPKGGKEVYQTTGIPFIRSQNVLKGILDLSDIAYIPFETDAMMKRTRIRGGETLFNITGASIGRACFVPYCQTSGNVNQHVCILRYKKYVVPELPQFWLNSPAVQDFVVDNQIGQTRQALNFKQIRGMYYPLAPIGEQKELVRILDNLLVKEQQAKEAAEAVLEKIDLLKKSILARAFRGELGTNDPKEESAIELIKQILSENIVVTEPKEPRKKDTPEVDVVAKTIMQAFVECS